MNSTILIIIWVISLFIALLYCISIILIMRVRTEEARIVEFYMKKVDKIPALIETMRSAIADPRALETLTHLHREAVLTPTRDMVDILETNTRIEKEFIFLMKLSAQIPKLQLQRHFIYIRDFIIESERMMRSHFSSVNQRVRIYNRYIDFKNFTVLWLIFPFKKRPIISEKL